MSMAGLRLRRWSSAALVITCLCTLSMPEAMKVAPGSHCAPLKNHGSHSTLRVQVGTPKPGASPQLFDLIADTGSSSIIVTNCICKEHACIGYSSPCFKGVHSSTFMVPKDSRGEALPVQMTFGSGQISAVLTTDKVAVGPIQTVMNSSLLMLYDHHLDAGITNFEGIFGVGIPYQAQGAPDVRDGQWGRSWLQQANVNRFSMCFSDMKKDGMLEMNTAVQPNAMGSVGKLHWGLDFRGISVGASTTPVTFCDPAKKLPGQKTACGMIPDSGTTLVLGPRDQISQLYADLCDKWQRCAQKFASYNKTAHDQPKQVVNPFDDAIGRILKRWGLPIPTIESPFSITPEQQALYKKEQLFRSELRTCAAWADGKADLDAQLPPMHFHVAGSEGHTQTLQLAGSSYVVTSQHGNEPPTCMPFLGSYSYKTQLNGPIWIVGTPLFYDYKVHYDISSDPPSMSFTESSCGSCSTDGSAHPAAVGLVRKKADVIRRHDAPVRMPQYDTSLPL
eukprot:TRINITY_DN7231_c0_g1_i1.p1 TRINITY_DN7231_c0_g1~~TRINITY_DN7231_c0_g1_i1.p1  ORF type:complete len:505 (+),score=79.33 TRINITY_DN7231_c0_g1_i1:89-1603(+)